MKNYFYKLPRWSWRLAHTQQSHLPLLFPHSFYKQQQWFTVCLLYLWLGLLFITDFTKCQCPSPHHFILTPNCANACTYAHHRGVFQAAKWGYGLIFLDVQSVFLTNSQISAREACQQGCAGWDKLRQVTTGGRREECKGKLQEFYAFLSSYSVTIKHISAIKLRIGLSFTFTFFVRTYVRKGQYLSDVFQVKWWTVVDLKAWQCDCCRTVCMCVCVCRD